MRIKFAIITDAHIGPSRFYKKTRNRMTPVNFEHVQSAIKQINADPEIEFVLQLGDLIQDECTNPNREQDLENLYQAIEVFNELNVPFYSAIGNHDTVTLTVEDLCTAHKLEKLNFVYESKYVTGLMLYTHSQNHCYNTLSEEQLVWLEDELAKANKPVIVSAHHPLLESDLSNNYWFAGIPENAFVQNSKKIREIISNSGKVIAVFSGHLHSNICVFENNIPYFTCQSINEEWNFG